MQKFTVFTVIFTVLVVVVAAETFVNKYLPSLSDDGAGAEATDEYPLPDELDLSASIQSNVLGATDFGGTDVENTADVTAGTSVSTATGGTLAETSLVVPETSEEFLPTDFLETPDGIYSDIEDFSNTETNLAPTNVYLTLDHVTKSGFVSAVIVPETFDGFLYKTISIGDLYGIKAEKNSIKNDSSSFAKIYVVIPDDPKNAEEIYRVIKTRAAEGLEVEINETNDYGAMSFFMNDSRRPNVAFLTVRINSLIYGLSYPKQYHPQIKALVSNLMLGL